MRVWDTYTKIVLHYTYKEDNEFRATKDSNYSGKKKYVNPVELPGFLHKFVIQFDLIFVLVTTIDKHIVLKLITHTLLYFSCLY